MPGPPPARPFGQLALDPNNPLTDLWLQPPKAGEPLPTFYPLQTKANLPANGQTEIRFAHVLRKPANIVHICDSDQVPLPTPADGMPLERVLQIPNTSAVGLGFPLPPGEANAAASRSSRSDTSLRSCSTSSDCVAILGPSFA